MSFKKIINGLLLSLLLSSLTVCASSLLPTWDELSEGEETSWYENGQLLSIYTYKNNKKEGAAIVYWENGVIYFKGNYKNNNKAGTWVGYKENGTVRKRLTGTFKDGEKISD